ncbi:50S ribosomal protein L6 [bacterium]|nr:50S ribosomal protein L6 [bacterium]MBU1072645.1 50S ribosomal protein L6 [bacterium]MBU1675643.1 50S ribosomal protein L6 [bacterium]
MSRIGLKPIPIPDGVTVTIEGDTSVVKGPKGELRQHIPEGLTFELGDGQLVVGRPDESKPMKARHGLVRALIANQVTGVTEGFVKSLEIIGVGYRAQVKGEILDLQLQYSHPVEYPIPDGIEIVCPEQTRIDVKGIDKQLVGQVAAEIRAYRKPEPYKGKGIRYVDELVVRKAGKAAAK